MKKIIYAFIISSHLTICGTATFAQIPYYIPTDSLVAWYPFNDNANDESGNGHHGVANNSTLITTDRCEIPNSAYYFNGQTSQITIPDAIFNGGWNGHTICCWFNSDTLVNPYSNAHNQCIINTYPHRGEEICFNYLSYGKYNFFAGSNPPTAVWDMFSIAPSQTNVSVHVWNHIAVVKDGTSYLMYINGALDTVFHTNIIAVNYYCTLVIGNISQYAVETFYGKLDDFGIWKRALTAAEILEIYNAGCNPVSNFACSQSSVCEKFCTDFTDQSTNNPTSWQWIFDGGSPSSSSAQNPTNICYNMPGTYNVTLITTNSNGNDTLTLPNYITVNATPPFPIITQNGYTLTSTPALSYQWQFNSADIAGATNQSYEVTQTGYYTVIISDANGCMNSTTAYVEITAVENLNSDNSVSVFPNPSSGVFNLQFGFIDGNTDASVEIRNELGQIVFQKNYSLNSGLLHQQLTCSDLRSGIYSVIMHAGGQIVTQMILIL